jgi:uncharacterized protein
VSDSTLVAHYSTSVEEIVKYTTLGRTGLKVGVLGLGMEHLTPENIGPVVARAVERGMNYIDIMIWVSERKDAFGAAIKGKRDKLVLAGHLSVSEQKGQYYKTRDIKECTDLFHDQLRRLHTDHVDILHLSYVDSKEEYEQAIGPGGILELALRLKKEGKARYLGTSGHEPPIALKLIETGHVDVVMQPVNLGCAGWTELAEMCHVCASRGVAVVVMKAFRGGEYVTREKPISPVVCLSYALSQPAVATVAMGVKNVAELDANLRYLTASDAEKDFAAAVTEVKHDLKGVCVYCNHCLPCESELNIPEIIRLLTMAQKGMTPEIKAAYAALLVKASDCTECGLCMERCPFGVDIEAKMQEAVRVFGT